MANANDNKISKEKFVDLAVHSLNWPERHELSDFSNAVLEETCLWVDAQPLNFTYSPLFYFR